METNEKQPQEVYAGPVSMTEKAITLPSRQATQQSLASMKELDSRDKKRIRVMRFIMRLFSFILSSFMLGSMSYALAKYFLTRHKLIAGNASPWPTPTVLWPSAMVLAMSAVTCVTSFLTLCAYCCGVHAANRTGSVMGYIGYLMTAIHAVVWAIVMGLFKMANTGHDLWGYSCSPRTDAIRQEVHTYLSFDTLCKTQNGTWYSAITEVVVYLLYLILYILIVLRSSRKKKMAKLERTLVDTEGSAHVYAEDQV